MPTQLPRVLVPHPHVRIDASILDGSPHVEGSRVPVRRLWAWHRGGTSVETLCLRYPALGPAKILDAIAFAYDNADVVQADIDREQALLTEHETLRSKRASRDQLKLPFAPADEPVSPSAAQAAARSERALMPIRSARPAEVAERVEHERRAVAGKRR